jgi:hypothetical protein
MLTRNVGEHIFELGLFGYVLNLDLGVLEDVLLHGLFLLIVAALLIELLENSIVLHCALLGHLFEVLHSFPLSIDAHPLDVVVHIASLQVNVQVLLLHQDHIRSLVVQSVEGLHQVRVQTLFLLVERFAQRLQLVDGVQFH